MGEVGTQAVRCAEARPLAQQHQHQAGLQQRAHLVGQGHAGLCGDHRRGNVQGGAQCGAQRSQDRHGMALQRHGREAVAQHDGQIHRAGSGLLQPLGAGRCQAAAQVGAAQVGGAVCGAAVGQQWQPAVGLQGRFQGAHVQRHQHGVARLGVGRGETQQLAGGQAATGAAQGDARGRVAAQG